MDFSVFIFSVFALQAVCLWVGMRSSQGMVNQADYFLAGRGLRFFPLMMTFLATQVGGGLFLGSAEESYRYGWPVLLYPLGQSLGFCLLGLGVGRRLAQYDVSTVAQIFERFYGSALLKKVASLLSILSLFLILMAQIIASNKFMASAGLDSALWLSVFWGIVIAYTVMGGLKAVVATDVVQAAFFVGVFLFSFAVLANGAEAPLTSVMAAQVGDGAFAFEPLKLYGWLLMPMLFAVIEQDMGQRCFAASSPRTVSLAALCAGALTFSICLIPVFMGVYARVLGLEVPMGQSVLMTLVQTVTSPAMAALVGCAVIAAIISTADSLINAISSNLSQDFNLGWLGGDNLKTAQMVTAGIAVTALALSFSFNNIVDMMIMSYELSVCCLLVPIVFALFATRGSLASAALSMVMGFVGFFLCRALQTAVPKELVSLGLSLMGYAVGAWTPALQRSVRRLRVRA